MAKLAGSLVRLGCIAALCASCGDSPAPHEVAKTPTPDAGAPGLRVRVGPAGGTFSHDGVYVLVPANAVDHEIELAIVPTDLPIPSGYRPYTVMYRATPEGQTFAQPLVVTFAYAGQRPAVLYWSRAGGDGYESVGGSVAGNLLTASVSHFSTGFVGAEATDGGTTDAGVDVPMIDAGVDVPMIDAGAGVPMIDAGAGVPMIDAGVDVPMIDSGADVPATDAGADVPVTDAHAADVMESCPATYPTPAFVPTDPCTFPGLRCEYDSFELRSRCRGIFECAPYPDESTYRWGFSPGAGCGFTSVYCLSETEMRAGAACTFNDSGYCSIPTGACTCEAGHFICDDPTATPGCPAHLPLIGSPCTTEALTCTFGQIGTRQTTFYGQRVCRGGLWRAP